MNRTLGWVDGDSPWETIDELLIGTFTGGCGSLDSDLVNVALIMYDMCEECLLSFHIAVNMCEVSTCSLGVYWLWLATYNLCIRLERSRYRRLYICT